MLDNELCVLNRKEMRDVVRWDRFNWTRAIRAWDLKDLSAKKALGLGECEGGLSFLFAAQGCDVICSDYKLIDSESYIYARKLHSDHKVNDRIDYEDIDATAIPYENEFDVVFFKSILGGIGRNGNDALITKVFDEIYKALKPGGVLFYVENLQGSVLLQKFRNRFSKACRNGWNYMTVERLEELENIKFIPLKRKTFGYLACIGPNETSRFLLGIIDWVVEKFTKNRYIVSSILMKPTSNSKKNRQ